MPAADLSIEAITSRLLDAYAAKTGLSRDVFAAPGTTVVGEAERADTNLASAYRLDNHLVVRCDPAITDRCRDLLDPAVTHDLDAFEDATAGWTQHGRGWVHVTAPTRLTAVETAARHLDSGSAGDRALIGDLAASDPEGAEWAEIEMDDLDAHVLGIVESGRLVAYASERPWDTDPGFGDIGVLAHPDHRRRGLTTAVTVALCRSMFDQGRLPLYRCDHVNAASKALADRVGFAAVAELSAVTWTPGGSVP